MSPSSGSNTASSRQANAAAITATIGGRTTRTAKSSSVSTSAEIRASRSPLRCVASRAGASGSIAAKNQTRRSARIRSVARWVA
jgi:hypothetical protein